MRHSIRCVCVLVMLGVSVPAAADPPAPDAADIAARLTAAASIGTPLERREQSFDILGTPLRFGGSVLVGPRDTTFVCFDVAQAGQCFELGIRAVSAEVHFVSQGDEVIVRVSATDADGNRIRFGTNGLEAEAARIARSSREEVPLPEPVGRHVAREVLALQTFDIVRAPRSRLLVRRGRWISWCEASNGVYVCAPSTSVDALEAEGIALESVTDLSDSISMLGYVHDEAGREETGRVLLRHVTSTLTVITTLVVGLRQETRRRRDAEPDVFEVITYPIFAEGTDCLTIAPSRATRSRSTDGRQVSETPLRAAPDRIPPNGLNPEAYDFGGAWRIEPRGGLRRTATCPSR
jgi:hypothetical protein